MLLKFFFKISILFTFSLNCSLQIIEEITFSYENYYEYDQTEITGSPRIAGGYRPEKLILAKYIVSLRKRLENDKQFGYTHFCAGSIITANKILTAAHCFPKKGKKISPSSFSVVAGTPLRLVKTANTQEIDIDKIIIHPKFSDTTMFHDIALLLLKDDIKLDWKYAAKIALPQENIKTGRICTVIGWGRLYMYGPLANELLFVDIYLHSRKECKRRYPNFSGKKICASDIYDSEKDACVGDSGGPLICNGVVTGIVSYGYGCASDNDGIYTNVFKYIDWINNRGCVNSEILLIVFVMQIICYIV